MSGLSEKLLTEHVYPAIEHAVRIAFVLLAAFLASWIVRKSVPRLRSYFTGVMLRHGGDGELEKRARTLGAILSKALTVLIWLLAAIMCLEQAGFNVGPILAGAGVVGLAVGFGAQNLVRDVISGLFILIENQIRVNDVAVINGTSGLVEEINLRTTVLRGTDGTVHVFPNGAISTLANMTREYSYYVFNVAVAYREDTDQVVAVLKEIADQMLKEDTYGPLILAPLEVFGVDKLGESAVVIQARIKTLPSKQWLIGREMNRRIKKRFDDAGIEIPFPQRTLHLQGVSPPRMNLEEIDREQLKSLVREVVEEASRQGKGS